MIRWKNKINIQGKQCMASLKKKKKSCSECESVRVFVRVQCLRMQCVCITVCISLPLSNPDMLTAAISLLYSFSENNPKMHCNMYNDDQINYMNTQHLSKIELWFPLEGNLFLTRYHSQRPKWIACCDTAAVSWQPQKQEGLARR